MAAIKPNRRKMITVTKIFCLVCVFLCVVFADILYYINFKNKMLSVRDVKLILEGGEYDAALFADGHVKLSSIFNSYGIERGRCGVVSHSVGNPSRDIGTIQVTFRQPGIDEYHLDLALHDVQWPDMRKLLWNFYAGSTESNVELHCEVVGVVNLFHLIPFTATLRPHYVLPHSDSHDKDRFEDDDLSGVSASNTSIPLANTTETVHSSSEPNEKSDEFPLKITRETATPQEVSYSIQYSLLSGSENISSLFPVSSFVISVPALSYDLTSLGHPEAKRLVLSSTASDVDLMASNASLHTFVSLGCSQGKSGRPEVNGEDQGDDEHCTILDSLQLGDVYQEFKAGRVNMTADATHPNFISRLIGTHHYVSGVKYYLGAESTRDARSDAVISTEPPRGIDSGRTRSNYFLGDMISPVDPDVQSDDVDCIAVDGDDVYDSVMCLNVQEGFIKTYLDIYDESGMLGVLQGVTSWALRGGIAFTTDASIHTKGGYDSILNVSASEDFHNASLLFQFQDDGVQKVHANVFTEWQTENPQEELDLKFIVLYNESIDVSGGFITTGEARYGGNIYHLALEQHVNMNNDVYDMAAYADGQYGGSWNSW